MGHICPIGRSGVKGHEYQTLVKSINGALTSGSIYDSISVDPYVVGASSISVSDLMSIVTMGTLHRNVINIYIIGKP